MGDHEHTWSQDWISKEEKCIFCDIPRLRRTPPAEPDPRARRTDPETSVGAAESVNKKKATRTQDAIDSIFLDMGPLTDDEVWVELISRGLTHLTSPSGARTRRHELVEMGRLRDSGKRKRGKTNRQMILWEAI